ncbi:hypothetical protein CTRI78_v004366 [Colletotrichum trifolii]|uniref:Uncharacterized protein n=1 Tax=Colletotrichum trifolii TaxID=5466 RepID=A0A4R8RKP6_COLTR|nr:hypothetical protein CTRI78_v004366 [Colletotrichum trifolii]
MMDRFDARKQRCVEARIPSSTVATMTTLSKTSSWAMTHALLLKKDPSSKAACSSSFLNSTLESMRSKPQLSGTSTNAAFPCSVTATWPFPIRLLISFKTVPRCKSIATLDGDGSVACADQQIASKLE